MPPYQVTLRRDPAKTLPTLPRHIQDAAQTFLDDILPHKPLERIPGKTKQLKGRQRGIMQYDLPSGYRLWYQVDQETKTVSVIYLGPHP